MLTPDDIEYWKTKKFYFFCPVHGRVVIPGIGLWRTTLRCKICHEKLERSPNGTIEIWDEVEVSC